LLWKEKKRKRKKRKRKRKKRKRKSKAKLGLVWLPGWRCLSAPPPLWPCLSVSVSDSDK
jgi:hypothetical protein